MILRKIDKPAGPCCYKAGGLLSVKMLPKKRDEYFKKKQQNKQATEVACLFLIVA